jgi:predicted ATPase/Flp pilus assembly protein TadD
VRRRVEAVGPPAELVMGGAVAEVIRAHVEAAEARAAAVAPAPEAQTFAPAAATLAPDLDAAAPTIAPDLVFGDTMAPRDTIEHNLPAERDPFVGREDDRAALRRALGERARLLTVVGMGGAGKTRLVVRYALGALERWPGGVAFCDLAEARSVDGLVAAVARGLDLALTRDDPVARVGHAIAGRGRALVILDNFEQVAASAEPTLGQWLDRAPEAAFVVTSRERLGLAGEVVLPLAPLSPPDSEALFVARAAAATGGFSPSDEDRVAIAALVALLDHLPLAIELAAARARVLSPARLLERMADRFRLLASAGGRRDRQATLRATLDWSWELLSAAERAALAQLAVFEGGFDLESAEAVVDVAELDDAPWTMDLIQALVDKSLVRALGDDRFDLLVSVREYAAARLDAQGARAAAEARHGRWFAGLGAEAALDALERHGGAPRRAALLRERDNLVAANRRAVERGDADLAVPTALAAWVAVAMAAPLAVGVGLLERTLAMPGLADGPRGRLAAAAGFALWSCGRTDEAEARYAQALAAARAAADARTAGRTLRNLGFVHEHRGALDAAADAFRAALAAALAAADRPGEGRTLHALGNLEQLQGERAAARAHLDQALAIHREVGDEQSEAKALGFRGNLEFQEGRLDRAADDYRAAQLLYARLGDRRAAGWVLGNLGVVHAERGELAPAREAFEEALAVHREVGDRRTEGVVLSNLGEISARLGRRAEARALFEAALAVNREVGSRQFEAIALGNLGTLRRHEGDLDGAAQRLREAVALSHEAGDGWTEGELLGELAAVCALRGEFGEGRDALARAVPLLREAGNLAGLGALHVARAELEARAGAPVAARAALDEAEALAAEAGVAPSSRLAQRLAEVRGLVEAARGA